MVDPIPPEQLYDLSQITDLAVSPDGERVAFIATEFEQADDERHTSIFTVPADGTADSYRLTRASDASSPLWSPDGTQLAFLARRETDVERRIGPEDADDEDEEATDNAGTDEEPKQQVWAFDLDRGGDARQLTDRDHGVREFDWGPDGERIVITARDPTEKQEDYLEELEDDGPIEIERLQHKMDGVGYTDDVRSYLFVVDLASGEERRLDDAHGAGAYEPLRGLHPRWNPKGESIAFVTCREERPDDSSVADVFTVDATSGAVTRVTDDEFSFMLPRWSPDGSALTFSGRRATNWYLPAEVYVVDTDTGERTHLTEGVEATTSWFSAPIFADDETVIGGFGDRGWTRLYRFGADGSSAEGLTLGLESDRSLRFFDIGGSTLAFSVTDPTDGHDIHVVDLSDLRSDDPELTRATDRNRAFVDDHPMANLARIETDSDGVTVESMLYYPDTFDPVDPTPHPVIMWIHGGPMSYDDPEFSFEYTYFTSRGYVVCKPNYRGSTSYGGEFADVLYGALGTVEVDDILAVADDLVARGFADDERQFATGFSYGGIATGFLITRTDRFAAVAAEHGVYDLRSDFSTGDSQVWMDAEFGLPWEEPDAYEASSSITDIGEAETPTLVTAGQQDWRCNPMQSEQLYVSLRKQGIPAKLVLYQNEHHATTKPERIIHRLEEIESWFERFDPAVDAE